MTELLEARNVTKVFGGGLFDREQTVALQDFSFSVSGEPPSITAIVGESGSGKTTLARLLLGLVYPTEGEVLYRGKNLQKLTNREKDAFLRDVQVIFQDPFEVYNPFYKVDHVLNMPIKNFRLAKSKQETRAMIEQALEAVGLRSEETLGRYPHQLSGGQRQRVMVARALLMQPSLIIADEPVSMVDASLRATILGSLLKLNKEFGISLIYITHDLTTAYQVSEDIIVLYQGSVTEAGSVETVVQDPQHPYTRLLVGSIPLPNPDRTWHGEEAASEVGRTGGRSATFCKFSNRCPYAMSMCLESAPPLYRTDPQRAAACFLYRESPRLPGENMTAVFTSSQNGRVREELTQPVQAEADSPDSG